MALSPKDALIAARTVLTTQRPEEATRLQRIYDALRPCRGPEEFRSTVQVPDNAPPMMKELARKADTNYLPLLVKTFGQVIKAEGYYSASDQGAVEPWQWWQRNRMDSRQTGLTRSALQYGAGYATALPGRYGRNQAGPSISLYSPREMTAIYQDPEADEWPMLAAVQTGSRVILWDEEMQYEFGIEGRVLNPPSYSLSFALGQLTFIQASAHGLGVCPVVRYLDRNLLSGEESLGIVEPLMQINDRITESTFQALVTDYFQAFKQRYCIGWVPDSEIQELKTNAGIMWYIDGDAAEIKVGELDAGTVNLDMRNSAIRDFAAIGQVPAQALGIDGISNISDATLAGLEAAKNREAGEITTSLGESHEQLLRLCAYIDGNESAADDYTSEVRWRDFEARSYAQTVDGLVKLVQGLGLDPMVALEDVPGMTPQKIARAREAAAEGRASADVDRMLEAAGAGPAQ